MLKRLFKGITYLATILLGLLFTGAVVLWVRSYWKQDVGSWEKQTDNFRAPIASPRVESTRYLLISSKGGVSLAMDWNDRELLGPRYVDIWQTSDASEYPKPWIASLLPPAKFIDPSPPVRKTPSPRVPSSPSGVPPTFLINEIVTKPLTLPGEFDVRKSTTNPSTGAYDFSLGFGNASHVGTEMMGGQKDGFNLTWSPDTARLPSGSTGPLGATTKKATGVTVTSQLFSAGGGISASTNSVPRFSPNVRRGLAVRGPSTAPGGDIQFLAYQTTDRSNRFWSGAIVFPYWAMSLALVIPFAAGGWVSFRLLRSRHRVRSGCCASCGYDMRATPTRCPECGLAAAEPHQV